jgi:hypothetical protein
MKNYLGVLKGRGYESVVGKDRSGGRWKLTEQGSNENMRFLRYGIGQVFKGMSHLDGPSSEDMLLSIIAYCDGSYETEDGSKKSFYTIHLYLNDSALE